MPYPLPHPARMPLPTHTKTPPPLSSPPPLTSPLAAPSWAALWQVVCALVFALLCTLSHPSPAFAQDPPPDPPDPPPIADSQPPIGEDDPNADPAKTLAPCDDSDRILYSTSPPTAPFDTATPDWVAGPEISVESNQIRSLTLRCDIPFCADLENRQALLRITGWKPGLVHNPAADAIARDRLLRTGYFAQVRVIAHPSPGGVDLELQTVGLRLIREVRFHGTEPLFESDLRRRMFLRAGRPLIDANALSRMEEIKAEDLLDDKTTQTIQDSLTVDERPHAAEILLTEAALRKQQRRQQDSIVALYRKAGYRGSAVQICTSPVDATFVDLDVYIDAGRRFRLGKVYTRAHKALTYEEVFSLFTSEFGLSSNFSPESFEQATKALIQHYRDLGYLRVRINKGFREDFEREVVDVYLEIIEGAKWDIAFAGNRFFTTDELQAVLTFKRIGYIDKAEIENSIVELRALYQTSGFYWVQIGYELGRGEGNSDTLRVGFTIDEGERAEVREIRFCKVDAEPVEYARALLDDPLSLPCLPLTGAKSDDLIAGLETQSLGSGAFLQLSQLSTDIDAIISSYHLKGYLLAEVPRWQIRGRDGGKRLHITLWVHEGARTQIAQAQLEGGEPAVHGKVLGGLNFLRPGAVPGPGGEPLYYSPFALKEDLAVLLNPYRAAGHALPSITAVCAPSGGTLEQEVGEGGGEDAQAALTAVLLARTNLALRNSLAVAQGRDTCQPPTLPEGCLPPDPALLCSRAFDMESGDFLEDCPRTHETVNGEAGGRSCALSGLSAERIDIWAKIEAGPVFRVGDFFYHGNFRTRRSVIEDSFPMERGNLFDPFDLLKARGRLRARTNIFASASVETVGLNDSQEVAAVLPLSDISLIVTVEEGEQRWVDYSAGFSIVSGNAVLGADVEFVEANLFGYGVDLRWYNLVEVDIVDFAESDGAVCDCNLYSLLTWRDPQFLGMEFVAQGFYDRQLILPLEKEEFGVIFELRQQLYSWLFTSLALEQKWTASRVKADALFTPDGDRLFQPFIATTSLIPRALFDFRDHPANPTAGWYADTRFKFAASDLQKQGGGFIKFDVEGGVFQLLSRRLVLGFGGRIAKAFIFNQDQLQTDERFLLGGARSLRGFAQDVLGPTNGGVAIGGELLINTNLELRVPILKDAGLSGSVFLDGGELVNDFADLTWEEFRLSAGLGLRIVVANIPFMVLNYGVVLDRRPGEPFGGLQFNIGDTF